MFSLIKKESWGLKDNQMLSPLDNSLKRIKIGRTMSDVSKSSKNQNQIINLFKNELASIIRFKLQSFYRFLQSYG